MSSSRIEWPEGLVLVPYIPIGALVMILRILIFTQALLASTLLSSCGIVKRVVLRIMCFVLGIVVRCNGNREAKAKTVPIVSNHVTLFDHLVLCLTTDCVTPHSHVFHWFSTYINRKEEPLDQFIAQSAQKALKPWHILPGSSPNGSSDPLKKFNPSFFELLDKVQPVAIVVSRPFPVKLVNHPINWVSELLWQLLVPFTIFRLTYLPPINRQADESASDYAERVRSVIAEACKSQTDSVPVRKNENTSASSSPTPPPATPSESRAPTEGSGDGTSVRLRNVFSEGEPPVKRKQPRPSPGPFDHLVAVIKEVLSDPTEERIKRVLMETNGDVDATIEILLDSPPSPSLPEHSSSSSEGIPVSRLNTAAESFAADPKTRQQSLQERRQMLLAYAKGRFSDPTT